MIAAVSTAATRKPRGPLARILAATFVAGTAMLSGAAMAQQASIEKEFPLPATIAEMEKGKTTDYESKKAGLGYSFHYAKKGSIADIYIYDSGQKNIPSGPKNDIITSHLERAKQEVYDQQKAGLYSGVQLKSTFEVSNAGGKPAFTCAAFSFTLKNGTPVDSFLCLTGAAKKFVKVRLTTRQDANSKAVAERFASELSGVLPQR